jgi:hypothetical protein
MAYSINRLATTMMIRDRPPVFENAPLTSLKTRANREELWLIVSVTAASSEVCKVMDQISWRDERVLGWLRKHAIASEVNIDEDVATAEALSVKWVPTVIAFWSATENDRFVGFRSEIELISWLDRLRKEHHQPARQLNPEHDMHARLSLAKTLARHELFGEALRHYLWLWQNIAEVDPRMNGVRLSFMAKDIRSLVDAHPPARSHFEAIRHELSGSVGTDPSKTLEWCVLNRILDEENRTVDWFDSIKNEAHRNSSIERVAPLLFDLLKEHGRLADLGWLYRNPLAALNRKYTIAMSRVQTHAEGTLPRELRGLQELAATRFRDAAVLIVASLRAAGRNDEAREAEKEALRLDPTEEMRLALQQVPVRYD